MALEQIADIVIETDVLVIGGGIAGCAAAAKAAEHGLNVTLTEKSKTDRSGTSGQGIDHYGGAFPRGMTPQEFIEITKKMGPMAYYGGAPFSDPTRIYRQYANGQWAIEELEKLGVTMRWGDGELRYVSFMIGEGMPFLRVHWMNVKPEMAAGVRKRGVNVLERTMVVDLLTNKGAVVGATAIDTRTGKFIAIKAKATVIATGQFSRCYDPETPVPWKYKMRYHWCPAAISGDGWAAAYRAGAELANMEQAGIGYRFRDDLVLSFGNIGNEGIQSKSLTWDGEEITWPPDAFELAALERKGKEPFYYSLEHLPDDFQKRIEVAYVDERLVSFKIAEDRGFNPRTHRFEMMDSRPNQLMIPPGIEANADFKSSVNGLYAIGDCVAGCHDVANAATSGFLLGDNIRSLIEETEGLVVDEAQVESQKQTALAPLSVKDGTEPLELESAIRYICNRYIGLFRAEGKLREGQRRLDSLRRVFLHKLHAKNPHELMRALEVRNIIELAKVHMDACQERKETRGSGHASSGHIRIDYPEANPAWDDTLTYQRMEEGKPVLEMRKSEPLNMELREKR